MNNIPVFLSQGGTATLVLREIPFSKKAYITLRTVAPGGLNILIRECAAFCRKCGAKTCFVSAKEELSHLSPAFDLLTLNIDKSQLPAGPTVPLTAMDPSNDQAYLSAYNRCFQGVSGAMTYDQRQLQRIYQTEDQRAYLALTEDGTPWGVGELHGNELAAIGVLPEYQGRGTVLASSLLRLLPGPRITLTVSSDNARALGLYEKLGFHVSGRSERWYLAP